MNQIFSWAALILCTIYGALTAFAAFKQVGTRKVQAWAAWGMVLFGLMLVFSAVLIWYGSAFTFWALLIGLVGIHAIAINNGLKMFGRINPSHHVVRLVISLVLLGLTYLGMK